MNTIFESDLEKLTVELLVKQGFLYLSPEEQELERPNLSEVLLQNRLSSVVKRLNPNVSDEAINQALKQLANLPTQNLLENNEIFHRMLTEGIEV